MMAQGVVFGVGAVLVLATPLAQMATTLMPTIVVLSLVIAAPIAWALAPLARARYARELNKQEPERSRDI